MQPPNIDEGTLIEWIAGALGALTAIVVVPDTTIGQKCGMFAVGLVVTAIFTSPVVDFVGAPESWEAPIAYTVGLLGFALTGKVLSMVRKADLWGLVSDIAKSWLSRR